MVTEQSTPTNPEYRFFDSGILRAPDENNQVAMGDITLHFNPDWRDDWTFRTEGSGNGFFYFNRILPAGEKTPYLLEGVTCDGAVTEQVEVVVHAEALQATPAEVLQEWGLSITP